MVSEMYVCPSDCYGLLLYHHELLNFPAVLFLFVDCSVDGIGSVLILQTI